MNQDEQREQRLNQWRVVAGSRGLVTAGIAEWLLGVSDTRIKQLIFSGRLRTCCFGGLRLIFFESILRHCRRQRKVVLVPKRLAIPR